jgi:dienelactone hydrolase
MPSGLAAPDVMDLSQTFAAVFLPGAHRPARSLRARRWALRWGCAVLCATGAGFALAAPEARDRELMPDAPMNEQVLTVTGNPRHPVRLVVTVFMPDGAGPFPVAVLNHGATGTDLRAKHRRYRTTYLADYFLARGYAVVLPMLRGYGGSEGRIADVGCDFEALALANAEDIAAVVGALERMPRLDANRIVVAGQSFGGWNSLGLGALRVAHVRGIVNFAGGVASSACTAPHSVLPAAAEDLGRRTRIPSLWIYGDNDRILAEPTWRAMYARYVAAGGQAELVDVGPFMENSHLLLNYPEGFALWVPRVDAFLDTLGMPSTVLEPAYMPGPIPPPSGYARIDDLGAIPYVREGGRELYRRFLGLPVPRVYVVGRNGVASIHSGGFDPIRQALTACRAEGGIDCRVYAFDSDVVWGRSRPAVVVSRDVADAPRAPWATGSASTGRSPPSP